MLTMNPLETTDDGAARILAVDDDENILETVKAFLADEPFELLTAQDGTEALQIIKEQRPYLVISDWFMPGMDGPTLCKAVKSDPVTANTYFIFLTVLNSSEDRVSALESGADDMIAKPFNGREFLARIHSGMRIAGMQREIQRVNDDLANAHQQLLSDVHTIAEIQTRLLPNHSPETPQFEFASHYEPSEKAGGDYYDYYFIDEDHLAILIADVSGHGAPAAVIMAITRALIHTLLREEHSPANALAILNRELARNVLMGRFVTVFYSVLDLNRGVLKYASAGHNPVYLVSPDRTKVDELWVGGGLPLNLYPDVEYTDAEAHFPAGAQMVLYTDGITEARNREQDMFGETAFKEVLLKYADGSASHLLKDILTELTLFTDGEAYHDDVTLVVVHRLPEAAA